MQSWKHLSEDALSNKKFGAVGKTSEVFVFRITKSLKTLMNSLKLHRNFMIMRNNLALIKTKQILDSSSVIQKITIITNL